MEPANLNNSKTIWHAAPAPPVARQTQYKITLRILAPKIIGAALQNLFPFEADLVAGLRRLPEMEDLRLTRLFIHMKTPKQCTYSSRTRKAQKNAKKMLQLAAFRFTCIHYNQCGAALRSLRLNPIKEPEKHPLSQLVQVLFLQSWKNNCQQGANLLAAIIYNNNPDIPQLLGWAFRLLNNYLPRVADDIRQNHWTLYGGLSAARIVDDKNLAHCFCANHMCAAQTNCVSLVMLFGCSVDIVAQPRDVLLIASYATSNPKQVAELREEIKLRQQCKKEKQKLP